MESIHVLCFLLALFHSKLQLLSELEKYLLVLSSLFDRKQQLFVFAVYELSRLFGDRNCESLWCGIVCDYFLATEFFFQMVYKWKGPL